MKKVRSAENKIPAAHLQASLLQWYDRTARDLPWRRTKDPYRIWVSEIMLQQTQVKTVIPYYEKWLLRFPDLEHLAKASLDEALRHWAGLGYYRRAKMLHEGSRFVWNQLGGKIPHSLNLLQQIPGIGRYTAGAISSIAFQQRAPLLDGNVIRILTRIFAIREPADQNTARQKLWLLAENLVPENRPGDFNQAMMELGAVVCLPRSPDCDHCPVQSVCQAAALGIPESFPRLRHREKITAQQRFAAVIVHNQSVLLTRQPKQARWSGLWIFPTWETKAQMRRICRTSIRQKPFLNITHGFTRYKVALQAFKICVGGKAITISEHQRWVSIKRLKNFALPAPYQKIAAALQQADPLTSIGVCPAVQ